MGWAGSPAPIVFAMAVLLVGKSGLKHPEDVGQFFIRMRRLPPGDPTEGYPCTLRGTLETLDFVRGRNVVLGNEVHQPNRLSEREIRRQFPELLAQRFADASEVFQLALAINLRSLACF